MRRSAHRALRPAWCVAAAVLLAAGVRSPVAYADEAAAAKLFEQGEAAYARKDYLVAARAFEGAFREAPASAALYSAALAWEAAGVAPRAADDFAAALDRGLEPPQAKNATARLAKLSPSLARVDLSAPPGALVSLEHAERIPTPAQVHVAPGDHEVRVVFADGHTGTKHITVAAGATVPVDLAADVERVAPVTPASSGSPPSSTRSPIRTAGWVGAGAGVVLAGVAVGLGVAALSARSTYYDSNFTDVDARDRAASLRTATNVAWISAGIVGATGIVVILVAPASADRDATASKSPALRIGVAASSLAVPF